MESMRHILVHEYEGVRLDIVWRTVVDDLPPLLYKLRKILTPA